MISRLENIYDYDIYNQSDENYISVVMVIEYISYTNTYLAYRFYAEDGRIRISSIVLYSNLNYKSISHECGIYDDSSYCYWF